MKGVFGKVACFLLFLTGIIGVCTLQPQVKAAVADFFGNIGKIWETKKDLMPYTELINETQEKGGYAISLNEVILSEDTVYAAVTIESEYEEWYVSPEETITVNGTEYSVMSVSDQAENADREHGEMVPRHLYTFEMEEGVLPDEIKEMTLHFRAYKTIEEWFYEEQAVCFDFSFQASKEELEKTLIRVPVVETISLGDNLKIQMQELILTEIDSKIKALIVEDNQAKDRETEITEKEYYLMGKDSLGNPIWYTYNYGELDSKKGNMVFKGSIDGIPSSSSEWIELQLYTYETVSEAEWKAIDEIEGEEYFMEDDDGPMNMVLLGDKFRIDLKR